MYDEFYREIEKDRNLEPELYDLQAIIEDAANVKLLPKNKYRKLNLSRNLRLSAYEAKSKNLRLYLIHESISGKIIILGGKKTTQVKDIKKVEKILREYAEFLKQDQIKL